MTLRPQVAAGAVFVVCGQPVSIEEKDVSIAQHAPWEYRPLWHRALVEIKSHVGAHLDALERSTC